MHITIRQNVDLSSYTSFRVGGTAETFIEVDSTELLIESLQTMHEKPIWLLGYGSNTLISDSGLPGLTIVMKGGKINFHDTKVIVDAGVWWDDVVAKSIEKGLWGIELMTEIPGSIGAGTYINIAAYGQSIGPRIDWVEVWDTQNQKIKRFEKDELEWGYKTSLFQLPENDHLIILRVCLSLSNTMTDKLEYEKALTIAKSRKLSTESLVDRRIIITEARREAGSLWQPNSDKSRTAGSFFRNPIVDKEKAEEIMSFDETQYSQNILKKMNRIHGGNSTRVSAAHVMLAAGFTRGQSWGNVKLNDQNLLKIEAEPGATAQQVYDVMKHIQKTCYDKLGVQLEPEARILGEFTN